ncbi:MAG TPA: hypothetical protein VHG31_01685, partial [Stellaceae bacterium]|nr:hypothetical protein [Stellaceae bacterium]
SWMPACAGTMSIYQCGTSDVIRYDRVISAGNGEGMRVERLIAGPILEDEGRVYLFHAVAGESEIALAELFLDF